MIASMTGFARRETTGASGTLVCEMRSVNHRFLEAGFRLPEELRALEGECRQRLGPAAAPRQGRLHVQLPPRPGCEPTLEVDPVALGRVLAAVQARLAARAGERFCKSARMLRWPGVVRRRHAGGEELLGASYAALRRDPG